MKTPWSAVLPKNYVFRNLTDVIQRIKQHTVLTDVMHDAGLAVSSNDQRTVKIRCFEHEDATPSLVVSPAKGLFNCFGAGCDAGGDVLAFVQQFYRMDFHSALNWLIARYSLDVADLVVEKTAEEKQLDRYKDINGIVAAFLNRQFISRPNIGNLLYSKGITDEILARFQIGYSGNATSIISYLKTKNISDVDISTLQFKRDDIFTNRIIYPIYDLYGRITHFYGRAVSKAATKYIGMSKVHQDKAHPLIEQAVPYGLHLGRLQVSANQGKLILVEGHNDVLGLHSHGINNVAAMMTSSPSEKQYSLLHSLHIKNVIICPDGDEAGFRTIRSINDNRALHQQVKIMTIPDGSDPDEFVRDQGPDAFQKLIDNAVFPIELIIKEVADKYQGAKPTAKMTMTTEAMKYMASLSGFEREFAFNELATITNIDRSIIEETVSSMDEGPMEDMELERKVIGECINDKARAVHALSTLTPEDFTSAKHSTMWRALREMVEKDMNPFTREMFIMISVDKEYLSEKEAHLVPTVQLGSLHSLDYAMGKLTDLTLRRRLVKSATRLLVESKAKKSDVKEILNNHMVQIASSATGHKDVTTAQQQVVSTMAIIHDRIDNPGMPGVNIGPHWNKFMHCLMGFQKGHMITVAGVTKAGKTTIAQNWNIQQLTHVGEPTLWVNLEMNESDLVMRNFSIMSGVDNNKMKVGNVTAEEKNAIDRAAATYHGFKLHVANMAGANVFDVINTMRRYVYTSGVRIVFIDYMQLIRVDRARGKSALWEEQNDVVAAIRDATSKLGVTCIVISQLNRGAMAEQSASGQFVSGTIKLIQDSDCFMGIRKKRKEELEIAPHINSALQIEYNRHGPQGIEIDLQYKYSSMQIREG